MHLYSWQQTAAAGMPAGPGQLYPAPDPQGWTMHAARAEEPSPQQNQGCARPPKTPNCHQAQAVTTSRHTLCQAGAMQCTNLQHQAPAAGDREQHSYILAPQRVAPGDTVLSGPTGAIRPGNSFPLASIPLGQQIHNVELYPGRGGQMARAAGVSATLISKGVTKGCLGLVRLLLQGCGS